jgi:hypothetical protein
VPVDARVAADDVADGVARGLPKPLIPKLYHRQTKSQRIFHARPLTTISKTMKKSKRFAIARAPTTAMSRANARDEADVVVAGIVIHAPTIKRPSKKSSSNKTSPVGMNSSTPSSTKTSAVGEAAVVAVAAVHVVVAAEVAAAEIVAVLPVPLAADDANTFQHSSHTLFII